MPYTVNASAIITPGYHHGIIRSELYQPSSDGEIHDGLLKDALRGRFVYGGRRFVKTTYEPTPEDEQKFYAQLPAALARDGQTPDEKAIHAIRDNFDQNLGGISALGFPNGLVRKEGSTDYTGNVGVNDQLSQKIAAFYFADNQIQLTAIEGHLNLKDSTDKPTSLKGTVCINFKSATATEYHWTPSYPGADPIKAGSQEELLALIKQDRATAASRFKQHYPTDDSQIIPNIITIDVTGLQPQGTVSSDSLSRLVLMCADPENGETFTPEDITRLNTIETDSTVGFRFFNLFVAEAFSLRDLLGLKDHGPGELTAAEDIGKFIIDFLNKKDVATAEQKKHFIYLLKLLLVTKIILLLQWNTVPQFKSRI